MLSAFIAGLAGTELTAREATLLREARPCGVILFARNVRDPEQVRRLTDAARAAIGADDILVLIDQEGGRVARLKPPHWRVLPPAAAYGRLYQRDAEAALRAARLAARLTAADLAALGINTDCAPVLDVPVPGSHDIIGDRAYGTTPNQVAALGRAVAEGFMTGGVLRSSSTSRGMAAPPRIATSTCRSLPPHAASWRRATSRRSVRWPTCRRR